MKLSTSEYSCPKCDNYYDGIECLECGFIRDYKEYKELNTKTRKANKEMEIKNGRK